MSDPKPSRRYDAIVVGARCAGSSTAMLLARLGRRVLLLDRRDLPEDLKASTHMVWHSGVDSLARWGLLERLQATGCRPLRRFNLDLGEAVLTGLAPAAGEADVAYAPRRYVLDGLLLDAAREAGVEFRPNSAVAGLLVEDGRVAGVRISANDGTETEERATIVVGAEGINSLVARSVGAEEYSAHPRNAGSVWAYFNDLPVDDMEFYSRPGRMGFLWYTNDNMTLAGISFDNATCAVVARNPDAAMRDELEAMDPSLARRVLAAKRKGSWLTAGTRGVCRRPTGPGWSLVGDAGLTMDPITAAGITNAFRDAELLCGLIHRGLDEPARFDDIVAGFEDQRNARSMPLYEFAREMGKLEPPTQDIIDLFRALSASQADTEDYFGVFAQTVPVTRFFDPDNLARIRALAIA
jgi:flavin-dependent dehydrogenase